jgi:hypothetical protein
MLLLPPPVIITEEDADSALTFRRVSGRIRKRGLERAMATEISSFEDLGRLA